MMRRLPILLPALLAPCPLPGSRAAGDGEPLEVRLNGALGRTALSTFAPLHAGLPPDHEAVAKALSFLGVSEKYAG